MLVIAAFMYITPSNLLPYMLTKERQAFILHKINLHNKVLSSQLSEEINVSEDTIRRDLQVGAEAINQIRRIKADICFPGINAIDIKNGVTDNDWDVVMVKQAMIDSAKKVVCLSIAEKINTAQPLHICDLNKVDTLITELSAEQSAFASYREAGVEVL